MFTPLLINPDHGNPKNNFPWGVLSVGSYLTMAKNCKVNLLDASSHSKEEFNKKLEEFVPHTKLVGLGLFTTDIIWAIPLLRRIKQLNPDVKIIVGGPHPVLEPEQTCRYKDIDFVAYGDGEETVYRLMEEIDSGRHNYAAVPGLIYKDEKGETRRTDRTGFPGFYDIDYDLLPESTRSTFGEYIQVLTGRGCSFKCTFCYNSVIEQKFIARSAQDMGREMEKLVKLYNPKIVYFRDENYFQDRKRAREFVQVYKEKGFKFEWKVTCRANYVGDNYINDDMLKELESINCGTLKMGIETGSQRMLNYLKKGMTLNGIKAAVEKVGASKIKGNYSFIVGMPTETPEEYVDTLKLIKHILKHEPTATILGPQYFRIYPGGTLYNEVVEKFNFQKPQSFEEWANMTEPSNDVFGLYKTAKYPWITKNHKRLAFYVASLVMLYKRPMYFFLNPKRWPALPFVVMAKLRMRFNWYSHLYDIYLFEKLYDISKRIHYAKPTEA